MSRSAAPCTMVQWWCEQASEERAALEGALWRARCTGCLGGRGSLDASKPASEGRQPGWGCHGSGDSDSAGRKVSTPRKPGKGEVQFSEFGSSPGGALPMLTRWRRILRTSEGSVMTAIRLIAFSQRGQIAEVVPEHAREGAGSSFGIGWSVRGCRRCNRLHRSEKRSETPRRFRQQDQGDQANGPRPPG